jgi:hypothetical protein
MYFVLGDRDRQDEVSIHVVAGCAQRVWRGLNDEIGSPSCQRPLDFGSGWQQGGIALRRAPLGPPLNARDLLVGETSLIQELAIARLRFPWRHHARARPPQRSAAHVHAHPRNGAG